MRDLSGLIMTRQRLMDDAKVKTSLIAAYKAQHPTSTVRQASEALGIPPSTILDRTPGLWATQKDKEREDEIKSQGRKGQ
jgi:hypothetical protein